MRRVKNFHIKFIVGRPMRGVYFEAEKSCMLRPTNENAMKQRAL